MNITDGPHNLRIFYQQIRLFTLKKMMIPIKIELFVCKFNMNGQN